MRHDAQDFSRSPANFFRGVWHPPLPSDGVMSAPLLLVWIGWVHGWLWLALGLFAFLSMFRNPLRYFLRRALGRPAPLPKELEK